MVGVCTPVHAALCVLAVCAGVLETNAYYDSSSWEVPRDSMMKVMVPVPYKL